MAVRGVDSVASGLAVGVISAVKARIVRLLTEGLTTVGPGSTIRGIGALSPVSVGFGATVRGPTTITIARLVVGRAVGFLGTIRVTGSGGLLVVAAAGVRCVALADRAFTT